MDAIVNSKDSAPRAAVLAPAVGIWLSYLAPLTVLSAVALSPLVAVALRTRVPVDRAGVDATVALGWKLIAVAWFGQLVLVGGAAAIVRHQPSQLRALGAGLVQLLRAIAPCIAAAAAIAIGSLALAVPGLVLLVLLSLTGASPERGLPAPLVDSIAVARTRVPVVALAVAGMLALDAAIGIVAHRALVVELPKHPAPAQLAAARDFVRAIALALVIASPLPATVLATIRARPVAGETDST